MELIFQTVAILRVQRMLCNEITQSQTSHFFADGCGLATTREIGGERAPRAQRRPDPLGAVYGVLEDIPPRHSHFYLKKRLA